MEITTETEVDLTALEKLTSDLKKGVATMTPKEARFLVDSYYMMQDNRIRAGGQIRSMDDEPHAVLEWFFRNATFLENQVKAALAAWANSHHMGRWAQTVDGVGPVLSCGLLAHIDITKCPTVGHIWRFAGLDPTCLWLPKQKRPWNASLKVLCWKIGESFVKVSGKPTAFYGQIYQQRKAWETEQNTTGKYADQAKAKVEMVGKNTVARTYYAKNLLPPGHIHARAKRYAVKLFLSHWHAEAYRHHYKTEPPLPYPIAVLGHAHLIEPSAT